jgi:hypothetical protein
MGVALSRAYSASHSAFFLAEQSGQLRYPTMSRMRALKRRPQSKHRQNASRRAFTVTVAHIDASFASWSHHSRTGSFEFFNRFFAGFAAGLRGPDAFDVCAARRGFVWHWQPHPMSVSR